MARSVIALVLVAGCVLGAQAYGSGTVVSSTKHTIQWTAAGPGLRLPNPQWVKCNDVIYFQCRPGETRSLWRIANVTGACPESFNRTTGVLMAPATESCSFNYTVRPSDLGVTMFFASGLPNDCQNGVTVAVTATSCPASAKTMGINPITGLDATAIVALGNDTAGLLNGSAPMAVITDPLASPKDSSAGAVAASAVLLLTLAAAQVLMA